MTTPHPASEGPAWRPATAGDIPAIVALAAAVDAAEHLEFAGGPEFWAWWLGQHDLERDTILAVDPEGDIVALGGSHPTDSDRGARAILWFDAHPDRLDLEPGLLEWAVERAREQLAGARHRDAVIRTTVEEHRGRRRGLLEGAGFVPARSFVEMTRTLAGALPSPLPLPPGVTIHPWTPEFDEAARLASNSAFAEHWGSLPMDPATWRSMVLDDTVRRDCSFVAACDGEVVAFCLAEVDAEDDPAGLWIQRVGTLPEWRRRGLASALLVETLRAGAAAGFTSSSLTVDEQSRFDATAVYARLGYEAGARSITYVLGEAS